MDNFIKEQRTIGIDFAKGFGVENPEEFLDAYDAALVKWRGLSAEIGTDVEAFEKALWDEVYSKVDPESL